MPKDKMRLGDLLVSVGKITKEQLNEALKKQKITKKKLGEVLVESGFVTETDIIEVLEFQLGIPKIDLQTYEIETKVPNLIPENLARRHNVIPVRYKGDTITVAMDDPLNIYAVDDIEIATDLNVQPVISTKDDIERAIEFYYSNKSAEKALEDFNKQHQTVEENDVVNEDISNAPAVRLVNSLIKQAVRSKASDIHIEPFKYHVRIRFRVDGQLQEIMSPAKSTFSAIITRVKIMGNMDIAEKRIPQDGRIEVNIEGRSIDLRISTLPTVYGEKVVMRLLDRSSFLLSKDELGFTKENLTRFNNIIHNPHGVILVTGPTGSGKTTTLYTVLRELNNIDKNIVTVEDPVEYKLDGINQVQVNKKAGLTFANGLRSILRQDPDIVMIGEIRDTETAQIAIRSAITGHLVLSTMHTNS
ncbi:MAG: type II secretion system protein GspE, partial [Firmicutes bacterium]|nr:type II secretion system protein GspE [Bacillota bacterium]